MMLNYINWNVDPEMIYVFGISMTVMLTPVKQRVGKIPLVTMLNNTPNPL